MDRRAFLRFTIVALAAAPSAGVAKELQPWKGGPPPKLVLKDLDGREYRLTDFKGKVLVVNFWATWCDPCREEMPSFNRLKDRMGDTAFAILAVNLAEGESRINEFLKQVPMNFPILLDRDGAVANAWHARLLPYTVVIGPDQRARYSALGALDWGAPEVEAALRKLLPQR